MLLVSAALKYFAGQFKRIKYLLIHLVILLLVCSIGSCVKWSQLKLIYPVKTVSIPVQQSRSLIAFQRINIEGKINVSLHTGYRQPKIILIGDPRDLKQIKIKVSNGMLSVYLDSAYPRHGSILAKIYTQKLNTFTFNGIGKITGNNLRSGTLDLAINNPQTTTLGGTLFLGALIAAGGGTIKIANVHTPNLTLLVKDSTKVKLIGVIGIAKINVYANSLVSLYWVKTKKLKIRGQGNAQVALAGTVNHLDVELWDNAHFNGRYLRTKCAFVKTHDQAIADLNALNRQHTLATNVSNIYFYNLPSLRTDFMANDGSVLDLRDLSDPEVAEYTIYNNS